MIKKCVFDRLIFVRWDLENSFCGRTYRNVFEKSMLTALIIQYNVDCVYEVTNDSRLSNELNGV